MKGQIFTDHVLPQLGAALDAALMGEVFARRLFAAEGLKSRYQLRDCEIIQARYKPEKNCLISYRLTIHDALSNESSEQIFCARVYEKGGSGARFIKAQSQSLAAPRFGAAVFHVPNLEMVVWAFPNERKLAGLAAITDDDLLRGRILPPVIAAAYGDGWEIAALSSKIVHYVAEHTCIVRVTPELRHAATNETQTVTLYGKTYYNDDGAETFERMQQLWESEARKDRRLAMALPLAYQPEIKTLWQAGLRGSSLYEREGDSPQFIALLKRAASALAALHQSPVSCQRKVGVADLLARFDEVERMISLARPESLPKLRLVIDRLKHQSEQIGSRPTATLHGDLHLKNFFVADEEIALIDLDSLCLGDPLMELGSIAASLHYRNLLLNGPAQRGQVMADAFIRAYAESAPRAITDSILNWYAAAALIAERTRRCVTRLKTERLTILDEIISLADELSLRKPFEKVGTADQLSTINYELSTAFYSGLVFENTVDSG
jgi:hypothetical protein